MEEAIYEDIEIRRISSGYEPVFPLTLQQTTYHLETFKHLHKLLLNVNTKLNTIYNMASTEMNTVVGAANKKLAEITKGMKTSQKTSTFATFVDNYLQEIEKQSKCLKNLHENLQNDFLKPLNEEFQNRRKMWGTCLGHATSFSQQIDKQQSELQRCYKQCSDAVEKADSGSASEKSSLAGQKALQIFHDLYNTCVLQRRCTETMSIVLCTDFNPQIMNNIEENHRELNVNYLHFLRNMLNLQKNAWCDMQASAVQKEAALQGVNMLEDLRTVVGTSKTEMVEKYPLGVVGYTLEKVNLQKIKTGYMLDVFIMSELTRPNLQRRLNSLNVQREQLEHDVGAMKATNQVQARCNTLTLESLTEALTLCEREANLSVTLRQKDLYTPTILDFLGPLPSTWPLNEDRTDGKGNMTVSGGPRSHSFLEPLMIKPVACGYCEKLVIVRGCVCEICTITVHKRCSANVQFCEPGSVQNSPGSIRPAFDTDDEDENSGYDDGPIYEYPSIARSLPELANVNQPAYEYADQTLIGSGPETGRNRSRSSLELQGEPSSMRASLLAEAYNATNKRQQTKSFLSPLSSKLKGVFAKSNPSGSSSNSTLTRTTNEGASSKESISPATEDVVGSAEKTKTLRVKYEFTKENENEISIRENDVVTLLYKKDDWTMVRTKNGEGYVPTSYVEDIE